MSLEELEALLVVQQHDLALDRLRHQHATLPERAELEACTRELAARTSERADVQSRRDVVHAEERKLDDEARSVGAHADDVNAKLYSGSVQSPRELQAMQADVEMLKKRRSELEVMEQRETLDNELAALDATIATLNATRDQLRSTIATTEVEIETEVQAEAGARATAAAPIAAALLADYEKRRTQNRGSGAARLVGVTCQACHLTIPSTEAEQIRRAAGATIAYCDNCGAILVP